MSQLNYNRVGECGRREISPHRGFGGCGGGGGGRVFRLNSRRFSVHGIRVRFCYLFKILGRLRNSYKKAMRLLKKGVERNGRMRINDSGRRRLVAAKEAPPVAYRLKSFGRSNSFYSEAIADCLEFIKRNSFSVDEIQDPKPLMLPGDK